MKFGYTIIYVKDVEETINFYKQVFDISCHFIDEAKQYAELDTGVTKLAFACENLASKNDFSFQPNQIDSLSPGFEIAFISNNVEYDFAVACDNGALAIQKPCKKPWGQITAYIKDLNGIIIEICSPITS